HGLFDLSGRVVMATGGNSGIGLGFLTGCARQGADVVIWDRNVDGHAAALERLRQGGARRTLALTGDVADERQVDDAMAETVARMGGIDAALANAGFTTRAESFPDMTS
ncbi:MAG: SDR family NAD(P)-dependent oxidoreductase, partial [Novosphingobium sp.]|nr:SDR family NAD(P)-dependent oxidoreductase [Novosphingobium sp.]